MRKISMCILLVSCLCHSAFAQGNTTGANSLPIPEADCATVDKLSAFIQQHYQADTSRVRAVYDWITNHISYNVALMQQNAGNPETKPQNVEEVLRLRSGVCQGYSDLFVAICKNVGIPAIVVPGYAKISGKVLPMAHAWVATELNGDWVLFDPTWGAGYVTDNKFVKNPGTAFYAKVPKDMILDHMPFDPVYQFLSHPVNNREFINGVPAGNQVVFNYKDSLAAFNTLPASQQVAAALRRLEQAGIENDLLQQNRTFLRKQLRYYSSTNASEEAHNYFNRAVTLINEYFVHKNSQFKAITDQDLLQRIDSMKQYIKLARSLVSDDKALNDEQQQTKTKNLLSMDQYWTQLSLEEQFVKRYIATDKAARMKCFIKM